MPTYARLEEEGADTPRSPAGEGTDTEENAANVAERVEVQLDLTGFSVPPEEASNPLPVCEGDPPPAFEEEPPPTFEEVTEGAKVFKISVTNGGAVITAFEYTCRPEQEEMDIADFKKDLEARLAKIDTEVAIRMLIYRGQVLQNGRKLVDYKVNSGDTLQLLTWVPEAAAAVAAQVQAQAAAESRDSVHAHIPRAILARADFGGLALHEQRAWPAVAATVHGTFLREEVERWSARIKVWTCFLMLIYSFKMLVGMSQSLETHRRHHSSELAFSFLGFWVAYIGLRAATRLNFSLARGYYYGQMTVAMCNLFLMAIRDPSVTGEEENVKVSANVLYVSFAINVIFWSYIVYGAYRFQFALWCWLQDGAPDHILEAQEDV